MNKLLRPLLGMALLFAVASQTPAIADEQVAQRDAAAQKGLVEESDPFHFGIGWATYGVGGFENASSSALSMLLMFNQVHSMQLLFGISTVDPFKFGTGLAYRGRVASQDWAGLHLGVLINVGNWSSSFDLQFGPLLGIQLRPLPNLMIMVDGGPILSVGTSTGSADADFRVGALVDGMLGFSIHYVL